ncbi:hypothetical protein [Paenibacillus amylolyticus]|uniref:hypothetical protein n=1 Tax=Paenibacillus amylolyticus TaxID=1451 RepID=UPI003D99A854
MFINWTINSEIYLENHEPVEIEPFIFQYKKFICKLNFVMDEFSSAIKDNDGRSVMRINAVVFSLTSINDDDNTNIEILKEDESKLAKTIVSITNIFAKAVRLGGYCPLIHEIGLDSNNDYGTLFNKVGLMKSEGVKDGHPVVSFQTVANYGDMGEKYNIIIGSGYLQLDVWNSVIKKAVVESFLFPPERAFLVNSIEQRHLKNYRIGIIEATIALEISLNKYLQSYLSHYKGLPKTRLDKFLGPDLGLYTRVNGLLILTLSEETISQIDLDSVLKFITWRNKIIHATGEIPDGLQDEVIEKSFANVINLIDFLSKTTERIELSKQVKPEPTIS